MSHNDIIKNIANSILNKHGIVQIRNSRTWIKDYFWCTIIIEFQPSMGRKGTYLNIGTDFHFEERNHLAFIYPANSRACSFVEFNASYSQDFENEVKKLCQNTIEICDKIENEIFGFTKLKFLKGMNNKHNTYNLAFILKLYDELKLSERLLKNYKNLNKEKVVISKFDLIEQIRAIRQSKKLPDLKIKFQIFKLSIIEKIYLFLFA